MSLFQKKRKEATEAKGVAREKETNIKMYGI